VVYFRFDELTTRSIILEVDNEYAGRRANGTILEVSGRDRDGVSGFGAYTYLTFGWNCFAGGFMRILK
jgi:hypothetical protein